MNRIAIFHKLIDRREEKMIEENFVGLIEKSIRENWTSSALADYEGEDYTYGEVAGTIKKLHRLFKKIEIQENDKIAAIGNNSVNWAIVYLAVVTYGGIVVPILPDFHLKDKEHILKHSDSTILFADEDQYEQLETEYIDQMKAIISLQDFNCLYCRDKSYSEKIKQIVDEEVKLLPEDFGLPNISNEDVASITYTSGTTGFSKGVVLTHNNYAANLVYAFENVYLESGDTILSFLPLAHTFGCAFEFLFPFCRGAFITFLHKIPSPRIILEAFDRIKPNLILSVPLILEKIYNKKIKPALNKQPTKSMLMIPGLKNVVQKNIREKLRDSFGGEFKEIIIGGAPLNNEVEKFLMEIDFPFTVGYGVTECAPLISYAGWKERKYKGSGTPVDTLDVKIDSENPHSEPGEVLVKGDNVFKGYYKNEEQTQDSFQNGWYRTGDLAIIDEEGHLFIKGRCKNMILGPAGENIFPEEIEFKINNKPYVEESLVIERESNIVALVYPDYEKMDEEEITQKTMEEKIEDIRAEINRELPQYSKINKMELYPEEFEKTPTKKIKRYLYK